MSSKGRRGGGRKGDGMRVFCTQMCKFHVDGRCERGKGCFFAHDESELRAPPCLAKTKKCAKFENNNCNDANCRYAHGEAELRTGTTFRTSMCASWQRGVPCTTPGCQFAHTPDEIRTPLVNPANNAASSGSCANCGPGCDCGRGRQSELPPTCPPATPPQPLAVHPPQSAAPPANPRRRRVFSGPAAARPPPLTAPNYAPNVVAYYGHRNCGPPPPRTEPLVPAYPEPPAALPADHMHSAPAEPLHPTAVAAQCRAVAPPQSAPMSAYKPAVAQTNCVSSAAPYDGDAEAEYSARPASFTDDCILQPTDEQAETCQEPRQRMSSAVSAAETERSDCPASMPPAESLLTASTASTATVVRHADMNALYTPLPPYQVYSNELKPAGAAVGGMAVLTPPPTVSTRAGDTPRTTSLLTSLQLPTNAIPLGHDDSATPQHAAAAPAAWVVPSFPRMAYAYSPHLTSAMVPGTPTATPTSAAADRPFFLFSPPACWLPTDLTLSPQFFLPAASPSHGFEDCSVLPQSFLLSPALTPTAAPTASPWAAQSPANRLFMLAHTDPKQTTDALNASAPACYDD